MYIFYYHFNKFIFIASSGGYVMPYMPVLCQTFDFEVKKIKI